MLVAGRPHMREETILGITVREDDHCPDIRVGHIGERIRRFGMHKSIMYSLKLRQTVSLETILILDTSQRVILISAKAGAAPLLRCPGL